MTKLEAMLEYVSEHNDFYKKRIQEYGITNPLDITQWPVLTRKDLQKNRYNMFSDGISSKFYNQQLHRQSSSGTAGVPINVYWTTQDWYASNLSLWRKRLNWYNVRPIDKCVFFTLNAFGISSDNRKLHYTYGPSNVLRINVSIIHSKEQYRMLVDLINEFNPKWLSIQPFVLHQILKICLEYHISKPNSLEYIETVGELMPSDLHRRATQFFKVPIANLYGSEEMNGIAYECPNSKMHILTDNVLVEVKNEFGIKKHGEGEVVITNLNNKAMPLIRYNQGDIAVVKPMETSCDCGGVQSILDPIKGRIIEAVQIDHGIEINTFMLSEIISEVNNQFDDIITDYEYTYYVRELILQCRIELYNDRTLWYENISTAMQQSFDRKIPNNGGLRFEIIRIPQKSTFKTGKARVLEIKESMI